MCNEVLESDLLQSRRSKLWQYHMAVAPLVWPISACIRLPDFFSNVWVWCLSLRNIRRWSKDGWVNNCEMTLFWVCTVRVLWNTKWCIIYNVYGFQWLPQSAKSTISMENKIHVHLALPIKCNSLKNIISNRDYA